MKKYFLINILICLLFVLKPAFSQDLQKQKQPIDKVKECVESYKTLSGLNQGGYSREISEDAIDKFYLLFERDASIYWDLYKVQPDSISQLNFRQYIDRIKEVYFLKSPVLQYEKEPKYQMSDDNRSCIVYLVKINTIYNENDKPIRTNTIRLRLNIAVKESAATIRGIFEDKRNTRVRSISPTLNYIAWDNVDNSLKNDPQSMISMFSSGGVSVEVTRQINFGASADIRLNREVRDGMNINLAVFYNQVSYHFTTSNYTNSFDAILDTSSANPFSLTVFDRTTGSGADTGINETLKVTSIEIPITVKKYLNPYIYFKGGVQLSFTSANTDINYMLNRTGGGLLTNLANPEEWRYLDKNNELVNIENYGFFSNELFSFNKEQDIKRIAASVVLGFGIEKQFTHFSFGIEPIVKIGINPLYNSDPKSELILEKGTGQVGADNGGYTGILSTMDMSAYRISAGINFFISYLFKH